MREVPAGMVRSGTLCYCWKLVLRPGAVDGSRVVYGFTDHDEVLRMDGVEYKAVSGFTASAIESGLGLKVDNLEVEGALSSDEISEEAIRKGRFDGADIYIYRVNWRDTGQRVLLRRGQIGEIRRTALGFAAELRGLAHQLSYPRGRVYQSLCDAAFGDERCGKDLSAYTHEVLVSEVLADGRRLGTDGVASKDGGWFTGGRVIFLSGENKDCSFDIRHDAKEGSRHYVELWERPVGLVGVGDRFRLVAGCDKRFVTCRDKFNNHLNYQGFPHIPGNDYVQYYPRG